MLTGEERAVLTIIGRLARESNAALIRLTGIYVGTRVAEDGEVEKLTNCMSANMMRTISLIGDIDGNDGPQST